VSVSSSHSQPNTLFFYYNAAGALSQGFFYFCCRIGGCRRFFCKNTMKKPGFNAQKPIYLCAGCGFLQKFIHFVSMLTAAVGRTAHAFAGISGRRACRMCVGAYFS